jgi:hypothetical protein
LALPSQSAPNRITAKQEDTMPFDGAARAATAVMMFDELLAFFEDGKRWIRDDFHDGEGNRCLVGAMAYIRVNRDLRRTRVAGYLHRAMREQGFDKPLVNLNDGVADYEELAFFLRRSRDLAVADSDGVEPPPPRTVEPKTGARWHCLYNWRLHCPHEFEAV